MGYSTDSTIWPEPPLSEPVRQLIDKLFATLDDSTDGAGDRLADQIFSLDGEIAGNHAVKGRDEIRQCRKMAWNVITKRRHKVLRVYTNSPTQEDLLLFGEISVALKNGKHLASPFSARLILSNANSSSPAVKYYEPIADTAPVIQAMKE